MASNAGPEDDLLGFMLEKHLMAKRPGDTRMLCKSARGAFEMADMISDWDLEDWV